LAFGFWLLAFGAFGFWLLGLLAFDKMRTTKVKTKKEREARRMNLATE